MPELLGTTQNELGLRTWLENQGHTLVTTSDKEGENSTFDKELVDAEVIITTPWVLLALSSKSTLRRRCKSFTFTLYQVFCGSTLLECAVSPTYISAPCCCTN